MAIVLAGLALLAPSPALAAHSDLLLALLVLLTALGIPFADIARVRHHARAVALLVVLALPLLTGAAWLLGRPFAPVVREGLLAVGLSSSEVAAVGFVALAGGDAAIALGALTGSLVLAALVGPLAIGPLSGMTAHVDSGPLLARFALVVLLPLLAGISLRSLERVGSRLRAVDPEREGLVALSVAALVYAALSGIGRAHHLGGALLAALAFLLVCGLLAELWRRASARGAMAIPGALTIAMRDFAVAAALGTRAFGAQAAGVPGVYGVLMLLAGTLAATRLRAPRALADSSARR
jgi:BASS family bile acid:Na+ symporter